MKLYLVDDYKIFTYLLPNKVEDAFLINYVHYSGEEETITFMADNNNWIIESTPDITFYKDINKIDKEIVQADSIYSIQFSDLTDKVFLYLYISIFLCLSIDNKAISGFLLFFSSSSSSGFVRLS